MTWVRLDDRFPDHPKVIGLSDRAFRAYVHGLCYSARHLTDGRIPPAAQTGGAPAREELVKARLWALDEDDTVIVHDYVEWNPSRAEVLAKREADSARKRNGIQTESERIPDGKKAKKKPERTREIGLRMAVGARGRDILSQFLVEAITLALIGGAAGIVLGVGGAYAIGYFAQWRVELSPWAIVLAAGFAAVIGVFFGFYPARKASRLLPIDALRYE